MYDALRRLVAARSARDGEAGCKLVAPGGLEPALPSRVGETLELAARPPHVGGTAKRMASLASSCARTASFLKRPSMMSLPLIAIVLTFTSATALAPFATASAILAVRPEPE